MRLLVKRHREEDAEGTDQERREQEKRTVEALSAKAKKIRGWLGSSEERMGSQGRPVKSNVTDNESAKMPSSHGVIQGYNGIAVVDDKHQVVVEAQAYGEGHEAKSLKGMLRGVRETFALLGEPEVFGQTVLRANNGFHSEESVRELLEGRIEAYVADNGFRRRDRRFGGAQEYKRKSVNSIHRSRARKYFGPSDSTEESGGKLRCPGGKLLELRSGHFQTGAGGYRGRSYRGRWEECGACELRGGCIRNPRTPARQVARLERGIRAGAKSYTQRMIERFDTPRGRYFYSRRLGTVEPVFANIRYTLGLDRFTLRGRAKVDIQWKLFCMVHNIGKLWRYAKR